MKWMRLAKRKGQGLEYMGNVRSTFALMKERQRQIRKEEWGLGVASREFHWSV